MTRVPAGSSFAPKRPAIFMDLGVLSDDAVPDADPGKLRFTPAALAALPALHEQGFALVIASNQPGLALGRFTRGDFAAMQRQLTQRLLNEAEVTITDFLACPHAPGPEGRPHCLCRKPAPGLLKQAALSHRLDLARSWVLGDVLDDVEAGRRAGANTVLVDSVRETEWRLSPLRTPQHRAPDLLDAAQVVLHAARRDAQHAPLGERVAQCSAAIS
jgi:D-glycero-D-manno-heptose 1,7-bisphosphate phosphatase